MIAFGVELCVLRDGHSGGKSVCLSDSDQAEPPSDQRTQALPLSLPARVELRSLLGGGSARSRPLQPQSTWETLSFTGARPPT